MGVRTESLISNEKICYVCGTPLNIHKHHVYGGVGRRKTSEKYGCWVYLCGKHHNLSNEGVHFNKELDSRLKELTQTEWEKRYGDRDQFIRTFGKSYL